MLGVTGSEPADTSTGRSAGAAEQAVELLVSTATAANDAVSVEQAMVDTLSLVCDFAGWPLGHAIRVGAAGPTVNSIWHVRGHSGPSEALVAEPDWLLISAGLGLPARVLAAAGPAWIDDAVGTGELVVSGAGVRGGFAFPILVGSEIVAVLEFFSREPVDPDARFLNLIAQAGAQLGRVFEREAAQRSLAANEIRFRQILDRAADAFVGIDQDGRIHEWNGEAETLFGWSKSEAIGCLLSDLIIPVEYRAAHQAGLRRFLDTGESAVLGQRLELPGLRRDGQRFPLESTFWAVRDDQGRWSFFAFARDITERKAAEEALAWRAGHDELTGLANRTLAIDRLTVALARASRDGSHVSAVFVDLDRFKVVNDSLGHHGGDRLLVAVAERLRACVRPSDTVARLAGDEFLVICDPVVGLADATRVAQRIQTHLSEPVELDDERVHVGASLGVALAGPDTAAEELILQADAAMYRAKEGGRGRLEIFNTEMRERVVNRLRTERELELCLEQEQMKVYYQPLISLADRRVVGVEALARWEHPSRGLLLPSEFISVAEDTGMILSIGAWVLEQTCLQARDWDAQGISGLEVAVNLSGRQLAQWDLTSTVAGILDRAGVTADQVQLCLEITESLLMADPQKTAATLKDLRSLGVRLAVDDFGTGYSSLAYLRAFPVDVVKIDRSFLTGIDTDATTRAIVEAICSLAHALDLTVVAEGVEDPAQLDILVELGCDEAQGFLFARPGPAGELDFQAAARFSSS